MVLGDGSRALSGSYDCTLRLWDLATGEILRTLKGHTRAVTAVAVPAGGTRPLSGSEDKTLRLWDLATGKTLRILKGHTGSVSAVAVMGGRPPRPFRRVGQHVTAVGSRDRPDAMHARRAQRGGHRGGGAGRR